jgi:tetratricopeptide (TPR) repeat protein
MRKLKSSGLVLSLALALGATSIALPPQAAAATAPAKPTVSKALEKPFKAVQDAMTAKKWDDALAKLKEIEAVTTRTPYDTFAMNQFLSYTYRQLGQNAAAIAAYEAQVDSGFLAPEEADRIAKGVAQLYYQEKNYPKASEAGRKVIAAGKADDDMYTLVAQAEYLQKKYVEVIALLKPAAAATEARGQSPKESTLALLTDSYLKLKDDAGGKAALEEMVKYYPKTENWSMLLQVLHEENNSDIVMLNIYRLMRETGTLTAPNDINEMAQLAVKFGNPGESVSVLQESIAANRFSTTSDKSAADHQLQLSRNLADADRASLGKFETEAKAAKTGEGDVRLGQAQLSYEQYDKALEALQRGIAKGGLRNADEAQIMLGITLLRLGRKDEAAAAFSAAKGADPKLGVLARLWALRARG